jgi:hypothetical protein
MAQKIPSKRTNASDLFESGDPPAQRALLEIEMSQDAFAQRMAGETPGQGADDSVLIWFSDPWRSRKSTDSVFVWKVGILTRPCFGFPFGANRKPKQYQSARDSA